MKRPAVQSKTQNDRGHVVFVWSKSVCLWQQKTGKARLCISASYPMREGARGYMVSGVGRLDHR